ncbi:hypothetical protein [Branchiibius cervicis]|uniref:Uncharacterized protein n=1 Tax=Branchiibius cervicis TaxID=908252 RepID=A0ABW2APX1_9MICO
MPHLQIRLRSEALEDVAADPSGAVCSAASWGIVVTPAERNAVRCPA